jgi:predicted site-specific integrase-resolvase
MSNGHATQSDFVKISEASKYFGVSLRTIYRWRDSNQIVWKYTPSGQTVYQLPLQPMSNQQSTERTSYVYVRVSSNKQSDDLQRQREFMASKYPNHKVVSDIGSGLNFKRRGLRLFAMLKMHTIV